MRLHSRWALTVLALCFAGVADGGAQELKAPGQSGVSASAVQAVWAGMAVGSAPTEGGESLRGTEGDAEATHEVAGPTRDGVAVGVRAGTVAESSAPLLMAAQQRPRVGQSKALMIVGGAALVAGLIVGGDAGALLAVGGAVVGLYGLYQFVR